MRNGFINFVFFMFFVCRFILFGSSIVLLIMAVSQENVLIVLDAAICWLGIYIISIITKKTKEKIND
jgi:hypothetical protein